MTTAIFLVFFFQLIEVPAVFVLAIGKTRLGGSSAIGLYGSRGDEWLPDSGNTGPITLPLAFPILVTIGILTFMGTYGDFVLPRVLLQSADKLVDVLDERTRPTTLRERGRAQRPEVRLGPGARDGPDRRGYAVEDRPQGGQIDGLQGPGQEGAGHAQEPR